MTINSHEFTKDDLIEKESGVYQDPEFPGLFYINMENCSPDKVKEEYDRIQEDFQNYTNVKSEKQRDFSETFSLLDVFLPFMLAVEDAEMNKKETEEEKLMRKFGLEISKSEYPDDIDADYWANAPEGYEDYFSNFDEQICECCKENALKQAPQLQLTFDPTSAYVFGEVVKVFGNQDELGSYILHDGYAHTKEELKILMYEMVEMFVEENFKETNRPVLEAI